VVNKVFASDHGLHNPAIETGVVEGPQACLACYAASHIFISPSEPRRTLKGSSPVVVIGAGRYGGGRDNSPRRSLSRAHEETAAWYATARATVEASAALEQAEEFRRALEEMGKEMRGEVP
jgi:hypothetical protein